MNSKEHSLFLALYAKAWKCHIGFNDKRLVPHQCGTNSQRGDLCGPSQRSSLWGQTALEAGASPPLPSPFPRPCLAPVVADMNGVSVGASRRVSSLYP